MSFLFSPYALSSPKGPLQLANRVVVAPMCQYSAVEGCASDWHLMHWANLLNSGSAMMILEATGVTREGRITPHCLGLWDDATASALEEKLHRARQLAPYTPVCIQLSHAGRKASSAAPWDGGALLSLEQGGWNTHAPSAIPQQSQERAPLALDLKGLKDICDAFVQAAKKSQDMGMEAVELHAAHGYCTNFSRPSRTTESMRMVAVLRIEFAFLWKFSKRYEHNSLAHLACASPPMTGWKVDGHLRRPHSCPFNSRPWAQILCTSPRVASQARKNSWSPPITKSASRLASKHNRLCPPLPWA